MQIYHYPWTEEVIDPRAIVPTMLHPGEQRLLQWLGREHYKGWGSIIDAGCFAGGSTAALGWGLRQNTAAKPGCLHTFDRFHVDHNMLGDKIVMDMLRGATTDEGFLGQWRQNTSGLEDLITLHAGDILQESWAADQPIEVCFVDVVKTWDIALWANRNLYPALRKGSVLIHQDFHDQWAFYIPLTMAWLSDYFERIARIEWVDVVFQATDTVPAGLLEGDLRQHLSLAHALRLHRSMGDGRNRLEQGALEAQAVSIAMWWNDPDQAGAIYAGMIADYGDIDRVKYLAREVGQAYFKPA